MLVTKELLEQHNPCLTQLRLFDRLYPDGVEDTIENINIAATKGLNMHWAIFKQLIKPTGCIIDRYGNKYWYQNSKLHRTDGPAIQFTNGDKEW